MEKLTGEMMSEDDIIDLFGGTADIEPSPEPAKVEDLIDDDPPEDIEEEPKPKEEVKQSTKDEDEDIDEGELTNLFSDGVPDSTPTESSQNSNIYSSIASAFADEGIFPDIDEDDISNIKNSHDFGELVKKQIEARLSETQKRLYDIVTGGATEEQTRQAAVYENVLQTLDSLEGRVDEESEQGDNIRRNLIYQDYINRGYTEEKAKKEVERSFDRGTDIEDAREALAGNRDFYKTNYNNYKKELDKQAKQITEYREKKATKVKDLIMKNEFELFKGLDLNKKVRQAALDAVSKPTYKDPQTGKYYTAIQKMQLEEDENFQAVLGLCYALTDGFTSIKNLVDRKANKAIKKGFDKLESVIANSSRDLYGNLRFGNSTNDPESYIGKGMKLDL